jgi:hypothetical protein
VTTITTDVTMYILSAAMDAGIGHITEVGRDGDDYNEWTVVGYPCPNLDGALGPTFCPICTMIAEGIRWR